MMKQTDVQLAVQVAQRLVAAASFESEITLTAKEAEVLVIWLRSEKYRRQPLDLTNPAWRGNRP